MKNEKLAIAIPTYNRAEILKENLLSMMDDIKQYNIPIYVSDDSSNNETKNMLEELKKSYAYIYYYKNEPSLGHDKNCLRTLSLPSTDYIWYLGDSVVIHRGGLGKVLKLLRLNKDLYVVNTSTKSRNVTPDSKTFYNIEEVLVELAWHMTFTGATIYKKDAINDLKIDGYIDNFPQLAISLNAINAHNSSIYWSNEKLLSINNLKEKSYWSKKVFKVFAYDWSNMILDLPKEYSYEKKLLAIKSHSKYTGIFGWKQLIKYREEGILDFMVFTKYYKYIKMSSHENILLIMLISIAPKYIIHKVMNFYKRVTK